MAFQVGPVYNEMHVWLNKDYVKHISDIHCQMFEASLVTIGDVYTGSLSVVPCHHALINGQSIIMYTQVSSSGMVTL